GSKSRWWGQLDSAEAEKRVDAFAIAEVDKSLVKVGSDRLNFLVLGREPITSGHCVQEPGVTFLFKPLKFYCLLHQRIRDRPGKGRHNAAGAPLGMQYFLPERDRSHTLTHGIIKLGPRQTSGIKISMTVNKLAAKPLFVCFRTDVHGLAPRRRRNESS